MKTKHRVFLLSPAKVTGKRAAILMRPEAQFDLAKRLRHKGAPLGEVFSFMSSLYFRGKLTYARAFAAPPYGLPGAMVITSGLGLVAADRIVSLGDLAAIAAIPIDSAHPRYVESVTRDGLALREAVGAACSVILLGSVATSKYVGPLSAIFGDRLFFPKDFVGRGDLSRGGLLLRSVKSGTELPYAPLDRITRHGSRPPRLHRLPVAGSNSSTRGVSQ